MRAADSPPTLVLDAGALVALQRADRRLTVLLLRASERGAAVVVPAPVLAQVLRRPDRQVWLTRLLRQPTTDVPALDREDAVGVGRLLAATGARDVVDAHVVVCARRVGATVVTSDLDDLRSLDADLPLLAV